MWYANCGVVKERLLALVAGAGEPPRAVVIDLHRSDLDVGTLDMLEELADALARDSIELVLADVRARPRAMLARSGVAERVRIEPTLDAAVEPHLEPAAGASRITRGG
jgi:MFS superfamily sulfate permease-like transporter